MGAGATGGTETQPGLPVSVSLSMVTVLRIQSPQEHTQKTRLHSWSQGEDPRGGSSCPGLNPALNHTPASFLDPAGAVGWPLPLPVTSSRLSPIDTGCPGSRQEWADLGCLAECDPAQLPLCAVLRWNGFLRPSPRDCIGCLHMGKVLRSHQCLPLPRSAGAVVALVTV